MDGQKTSLWKKFTSSSNFGLFVGLLVLLVVAWFITPAMFTTSSILGMLRNNAVYGILSIAMMLVIIPGGIDLSVASTLAFAGIASTIYASANPEAPVIISILIAMGIGLCCGAFNGLLVGYFKMVPMIATLGTMYIFRGFAFLISGGNWWFPHQYPMTYQNVAIGTTFGIFNILWIVVIAYIIAAIFFGHTTLGRRIYAIGTSSASSQVAGIKENNVTFLAFLISGALCGLAGMLYTANYAMGFYGMAEGYEMQAIAICILGGVNINGGRGKVSGVVIGFLMMSVITYFIGLLPGLSVWQDAIKGGIIIIAVLINVFTARSAEKAALKERGALI